MCKQVNIIPLDTKINLPVSFREYYQHPRAKVRISGDGGDAINKAVRELIKSSIQDEYIENGYFYGIDFPNLNDKQKNTFKERLKGDFGYFLGWRDYLASKPKAVI